MTQWHPREDKIKELRSKGKYPKEIAFILGISEQALYQFCSRRGIRFTTPNKPYREMAEFSIDNGIEAAAEKFKVSCGTITNARKKFGISGRNNIKCKS
jgi:hypothetical protein